jgi:hypothetical protein
VVARSGMVGKLAARSRRREEPVQLSVAGSGRRSRVAALACGAVLLLAACSGAPEHPAAEPTTSSRLRTPAETCALQVGYWATELLGAKSDKGYDYQEMGLTDADYRLVLAITKQAKQLRRTASREETLAFVTREAQRRCAGRTATTCTTAAGGGWPC